VAKKPRIAKCRFSARPAEPALGALSPDTITAFRRTLEQPAARRESVSHVIGNEGSENGAENDIREVVLPEQHPARRDPSGNRVEQHLAARPQHANHRGEGEDVGGVAGGKRRVIGREGEKLELKGAHGLKQLGPGASENVLDEAGDQARASYADEDKADGACDETVGRSLPEPEIPLSQHERKRHRGASRYEHPVRHADIGDRPEYFAHARQ